jgi:carbon dioxide concentrating mechanism protein CcmM
MNKKYRLLLATALISISMITIAMGLDSMLSSLTAIIMPTVHATPLSHVNGNNTNQDKNHTRSNVSQSSSNISPNVRTSFIPNTTYPHIDHSAYIHPSAVIIGDCYIGKDVLVAPTAVCRGDTGIPIYVGNFSNIQDGAIIHAAQTMRNGTNIDNKRFSQTGERLFANDTRFSKGYAVYIKGNTTLAHDSLVHGPAWIGNNTMIGMKSIVFDAKIGNNVVIRLGSIVTGVNVADNKLVPIGSVITNQTQADHLPSAIGNPSQNLNRADLLNSQELAKGYREIE